MGRFRFEAEIVLADAVPAGVVGQRVYGDVCVSAEWPREMSGPVIRVAVEVTGELVPRDAPAYVELFFHDVFVLLNLAAPGSFGGTISITGGELRVRELELDPRVFATAGPFEALPIEDVMRWYDGLQLGTQQLATSGVAIALVQLLHLSRGPECEADSILRLAVAAEAMGGSAAAPRRLFELRDDIAYGRAPIVHPLHDDGLDPRVEDATREWIEVADVAAQVVISALRSGVARR